MNNTMKALIGGIAIIWLIALAGLVAFASQRPAETVSGGFEEAISKLDEAGLTAGAVAPFDAYGDNHQAFLVACPGVTEGAISEYYGIDASILDLGGAPVGEDDSYVLLLEATEEQVVATDYDHIDINAVNLCIYPEGPGGSFDMLLPVQKLPNGSWVLLA